MCVWGALYRISPRFLETTLIERGRGLGVAYRRTEVTVEQDGRECSALIYVVVDKARPESLPSEKYVAQVIDGGKASDLPESYITFLESLRDQPRDAFRQGYFALPTTTRSEADGMGLFTRRA